MTPAELKAWRTRRGLSQLRLAVLLGVSGLSVSRWERADRPIPPWLHLALDGLIHNAHPNVTRQFDDDEVNSALERFRPFGQT